MCTKKVMDHFMNPLNMREIDIAVSHLEKEVGKDFERWMQDLHEVLTLRIFYSPFTKFYPYFFPFTFKSLKLLSVTIIVAPISARIAIHNVSQPGNIARMAIALIISEKPIF